MSIVVISDVHIEREDDEASQLFSKFLSHPKVIDSKTIILLGDIFDLMVGGKLQYLDKYPKTFTRLIELAKSGKEIIFFAGNHDFHLQKIFLYLNKTYNISVQYSENGRFFCDGKIYMEHGDDVEVDNLKHQRYKSFITNNFMKFLGDYIVPHWLIDFIGTRASEKSRKRNIKYSELRNEEEIRNKFRKSFQIFCEDNPDVKVVICGHSHVKDLYEDKKGRIYINNGFAIHSKSFIKINDNSSVDFVDLV